MAASYAEAADPAEHQERADPDNHDIGESRQVRSDHEPGDHGRREGTGGGLVEHDPLASLERGRDGRDRDECERWREHDHEPLAERELPGDREDGRDRRRGDVAEAAEHRVGAAAEDRGEDVMNAGTPDDTPAAACEHHRAPADRPAARGDLGSGAIPSTRSAAYQLG